MHVRNFQEADRAACWELISSLTDWFGHIETNKDYVGTLGERPAAVVEADGEIVGFTSIEQHDSNSLELYVIAVRQDHHRSGAGTMLLNWVEDYCRREGARFLHVKTRGPLTPDPGYERTRQFYLAKGFSKLFETLDLWGPEDSALIMIKTIE